MKKLLVFSVSILCLALALGIVLHQLGDFAVAGATAPMATEVITASGDELLDSSVSTTIPWPTYQDGSQATQAECHGIVSQRTGDYMSYVTSREVAGLGILNNGAYNIFEYLIVCTRNAPGTVAVEETTWGQVKSLYKD